MSISYQTVINRMIKELKLAKKSDTNKRDVLKHIYHVHGLCELLIDQTEPSHKQSTNISNEQISKLLHQEAKLDSGHLIDEDDDSLFDF